MNGVRTWDYSFKSTIKKTTTRAFTLVRKLNSVDDKKENLRFYAGLETQHGRQQKDNNSRFYTRQSGLEIQPSTALKFLTIIERKAKN